ncbi:MAG: sigma-70 family RNA polymerase sigma factor [Proteobacteria bacterium]|nr:sigma-70 family RNA polymerase sigma factor [Pseudomonadota bacterium]
MSDDLAAIRTELVALLPRLRRFARALTRHAADADDVLQAALEKALARIGSWQPGTRLDSWMFTIVRNTWLDEVRARRRRGEVDVLDTALATVPAAEGSVDDTLSVQRAMESLPEEQRSALLLVLVEGLPYREAATVLDIPIGTLTSRLARGREALQRLLGGRSEP